MPYQITSRLLDSSNLIPSHDRAQRMSSQLLRIGAGGPLLAFQIAGDHIHVLVDCKRKKAGEFARAYEAAMTRVFDLVGFRLCRVNWIEPGPHAFAMIGYLLGQHEKHGVVGDQLGEAGCGLDLLGVRLVDPGLPFRVANWLPKLRQSDITPFTGVPRRGTDSARLAEAFSVVTGGLPLNDAGALAKRARAGAVVVGDRLDLTTGGIAERLEVHRATVARLRHEADAAAVRAISLAIGLLQDRAPDGLGGPILLPSRVELARDQHGRLRSRPISEWEDSRARSA